MAAMITIRKSNTELNVPEDQKERYLKLGYSVFDKEGNLVEEAPTNDVGALHAKILELMKENEKLKAENKKLSAAKKTATKKAETDKNQ